MSEEEIVDPAAVTPDEAETEASALAVDMGGNKMVPLSALIAAKREGKGHRDRVKELEPQIAEAQKIGARLDAAQPIIDALTKDPTLRAQALRISQGGTRTSATGTEQPDETQDPDAAAFAELNQFYMPDGMTLDVARARRGLELLDRRSGRQTDERIAPLAGVTLSARANENIRAAMNATDNDGTPWATRESIEEVVRELPRNMLADPKVADVILNTAIGVDRRKGRTPKPIDEPLFLDRNSGGGRQREAPLSAMERRHLEASGISEKDYRASSAKLEQGVASRRGIEFGSKR